MKKMRISAFVVFMIGMISILIHMFTLKASSNANPTEVTDPTVDTETTIPPMKEYPVVQLANDTYKFNELEDKSEDESEMNRKIEPFVSLTEEEKETFLLLFIWKPVESLMNV